MADLNDKVDERERSTEDPEGPTSSNLHGHPLLWDEPDSGFFTGAEHVTAGFPIAASNREDRRPQEGSPRS